MYSQHSKNPKGRLIDNRNLLKVEVWLLYITTDEEINGSRFRKVKTPKALNSENSDISRSTECTIQPKFNFKSFFNLNKLKILTLGLENRRIVSTFDLEMRLFGIIRFFLSLKSITHWFFFTFHLLKNRWVLKKTLGKVSHWMLNANEWEPTVTNEARMAKQWENVRGTHSHLWLMGVQWWITEKIETLFFTMGWNITGNILVLFISIQF